MRILFIAIALSLFVESSYGEDISYLSFHDLQAVYNNVKPVFKWSWPRVQLQDRESLIRICRHDSESSSLKTFGEIEYIDCIKDPTTGILYLDFEVNPKIEFDERVIYFFDPKQKKLMLKTLLSLS
jgi:hypothetical protein